jgi:hypothetical protein
MKHVVNITQYLYELELDLFKKVFLQRFAFQVANFFIRQQQKQAALNCSAFLYDFFVLAHRLAHT